MLFLYLDKLIYKTIVGLFYNINCMKYNGVKMYSRNDVESLVNECSVKLRTIGDNRTLEQLLKDYRNSSNNAGRQHISYLIYITEFQQTYLNRNPNQIEFEICQPWFDLYVNKVKEALINI